MAKKESYYTKHRQESGLFQEQGKEKVQNVPVTEEIRRSFEEGKVLLIDKPLHWTSFDVVRKIRNSIKIKKVGHAGTLDPLASGLLIVCTGKFTKRINEFMAAEKEYTGSFTIGAVTPTYDKESLPQDNKTFNHITERDITRAAKKFKGEIEQIPPVYSAIKKDGVALYELARRGVEVELKARPVTISEIEITRIELPEVFFRVVCSTGTYIRSLANDIGAEIGVGAYLSELRRTRIGEFSVSDSIGVSEFLSQLQTGSSLPHEL